MQELLKEYTNKLRLICESKSQDDFRGFLVNGITAAVIFIPLTYAVILFFREGTNSLIAFAASVSVICILMVVIASYSSHKRRRYTFDADQIASSLRRLIKLSSQYNEHAPSRISQKFEFEIRLAEAEASLRYYYKIFTKEPPRYEEEEWKISNKYKIF
jgi:hypothetical protein